MISSKPHAIDRCEPMPTSRDMLTFRVIAQCGGLTAAQVSTLLYPAAYVHGKQVTHSNCQNRLKLFRQHGYLQRIERYQLLSEGKRAYVYTLTKKGAACLAQWLGCEVQDLDWRQTDIRLTKDYIEHLILNNDVRIAVLRAVNDTPGMELVTWLDELTLKRTHSTDKLRVRMSSGKTQNGVIIPDDYFVVRVAGAEIPDKAFFVETDRATETGISSDESRRTWERKIRMYLEYFRPGGLYQKRYGTHRGRILTITTSERRLANLKAVTEQAGGRQRFWFTTFDKVSPASVLFEPIWQLAAADGVRAIFGESEN
jgi:hypothetical protein